MVLPVILGMAAAGLAKGLMDKEQEKADRKEAAEMARWSPWTGMGPNKVQRANVLGSVMQGGMSGAMMGNLGGAFGGGGEAAAAAEAPASAIEGNAEFVGPPSSAAMTNPEYQPFTPTGYSQSPGAANQNFIPWSFMGPTTSVRK